MTVAPMISRIYGIPNSDRNYPYRDLNEVLNTIGVMAKRTEMPFARIAHPTKKKKYDYRSINGMAYVVPKDWRNCLYEDLETGDYYIVSPHPENEEYNSEYQYSWIAFKITGLTDRIIHIGENDSGKLVREELQHSGSFIDLMCRRNLNEILDTLAKTQKPIVIKILRILQYFSKIESRYHETGIICQFDI